MGRKGFKDSGHKYPLNHNTSTKLQTFILAEVVNLDGYAPKCNVIICNKNKKINKCSGGYLGVNHHVRRLHLLPSV